MVWCEHRSEAEMWEKKESIKCAEIPGKKSKYPQRQLAMSFS